MNEGQKKIVKLLGLFVLCLFLSIAFFGMTGCANIAQVEANKAETEYRKHLLESANSDDRNEVLYQTVEERSYYEEVIRCDNYVSQAKRELAKERYGIEFESDCEIVKVQRVYPTPIEMPQEWLDQWPSLREKSSDQYTSQ